MSGHGGQIRGVGVGRWNAAGPLFVLPFLIGFAVFMLFPAGMSLYYSFTDYSMIEPPVWRGLENYRRLASDPVFWKVTRNTAVYSLAAVPLSAALGLAIAMVLHARLRGGMWMLCAVYLPTLVPAVATAMVWLWMFNGELGLVNAALGLVGVRGPNWLQSVPWIMPSMVLIALWGVGQSVVIFGAALRGTPKELYDAAEIDGAGRIGGFLHVTAPMISPVMLFVVITGMIGAWQIFAVPYIMLGPGGGADRAGYFYTSYLYDTAFGHLDMGYASAMAWVQLLLIMGLTALMLLVGRRLVFHRAG